MIRITKPRLAKCSNRKETVHDNVMPWKIVEAAWDGDILSFNFFVKWGKNGSATMVGPLWLTRLLIIENGHLPSCAEIVAAFELTTHFGEFKKLSMFARQIGCSAQALILPELYKIDENSPLYVVEEVRGELVIEQKIVQQLVDDLIEIRGESVKMGRKGLTYGTSAIECWLSKKGVIYPGDCDALLIKNNKPIAIIEYKKHTLDGRSGCRIDDHLVTNYYPHPDGRKYNSIFALQEKLEKIFNTEIPVLVFYYATKYEGFRLQNVKKKNGKLHIVTDSRDTSDINEIIPLITQL